MGGVKKGGICGVGVGGGREGGIFMGGVEKAKRLGTCGVR